MLPTTNQQAACDSYRRWIDPKQNRRDWLKKGSLTAFAAGSLWTTLAESLALANSKNNTKPSGRPKSMIVLWMQGGPSQLETFDPHPNSPIGGRYLAQRFANREHPFANRRSHAPGNPGSLHGLQGR